MKIEYIFLYSRRACELANASIASKMWNSSSEKKQHIVVKIVYASEHDAEKVYCSRNQTSNFLYTIKSGNGKVQTVSK